MPEQLQQQAEGPARGRGRRKPGVLGRPREPSGGTPVTFEKIEPERLGRAGQPSPHSSPSRRKASARRNGARTGGNGASTASTSGVASGSNCSIAAAQPAPAAPNESTVCPTSRCRAIAVPSANGCATTLGGLIHSRPSRSSSSSRIAGEATVIGTNAAQ
jgi:hypothetical protein